MGNEPTSISIMYSVFSIRQTGVIKTVLFLLAVSFISSCSQKKEERSLPWLSLVDPDSKVSSIHTVSSSADVSVSDGLTYQTNTLFHDRLRAIFQRVYEDRTVTEGVDGEYVWRSEGTEETEISDFMKNVILGHQFHAQILFFEDIHASLDSAQTTEFNGESCLVLTSKGNPAYQFYYQENDYPLGFKIVVEGGDDISFVFSDWREVSQIKLPYSILIDDGSREFQYTFSNIELNKGNIEAFKSQ